MTELKTLKDIPIRRHTSFMQERASYMGIYEYQRHLKAEAIKWVKRYWDDMDVQYFMGFFNLTEEDLKESGK